MDKDGAEVITELIRFANAYNISIYSLDCGTYVKRLHPGTSTSLSNKDGSLEYDQIKFFPKVTNQFKKWEGASVFMQLYLPHGKPKIQPEFLLLAEEMGLRPLPKLLVSEFWNEKLNVWSSIFKLDLDKGTLGENSLYVEFPESEEGAVLSKEMKLTIIR
jgi:hypothetical protein